MAKETKIETKTEEIEKLLFADKSTSELERSMFAMKEEILKRKMQELKTPKSTIVITDFYNDEVDACSPKAIYSLLNEKTDSLCMVTGVKVVELFNSYRGDSKPLEKKQNCSFPMKFGDYLIDFKHFEKD